MKIVDASGEAVIMNIAEEIKDDSGFIDDHTSGPGAVPGPSGICDTSG